MPLRSVQKILKSSDGMEIFAEATGDPSNPHVVLLHGLSYSGAIFDDFCEREDVLTSLYVVRADIRGHGRSGKPVTPEGHLSHLYADDYKAVIDAYGLRAPVHAGWSLGGFIATDISAHLGADALSGIFYLSSLACFDDLPKGGLTPRLVDIFARAKNPVLVPQALVELFDACFTSDIVKPVPYHMRCLWLGMGAAQPQVCRAFATTREQDSEPLWTAIKEGMPVCLCYGTSDANIFPRYLEDQLREIGANVEVVTIPGGGHTPTWDDPDKVAEALIGFARRVWKGEQEA
ncbi:Alpha/Beta hydrolase protein [Amylostereum chailletii]|nr:Alpha/Beta hydrolase protein [Amylostereum chailletii]